MLQKLVENFCNVVPLGHCYGNNLFRVTDLGHYRGGVSAVRYILPSILQPRPRPQLESQVISLLIRVHPVCPNYCGPRKPYYHMILYLYISSHPCNM